MDGILLEVSELAGLLTGRDDSMPLDIAALRLAQIEFPGLDPGPFLEILDSHAAELSELMPDSADGDDFINAANHYLFDELGFTGNVTDYYDPLNSCLNEVLARRTGIPITLSIVYMEIARRLGRPVRGIGLPGHFVIQYDDGRFSAFIDVFHAGRPLSAEQCWEIARESTGQDYAGNIEALRPASKREILVRMLNNFRGIYVQRRDWPKACAVFDLLVEAEPDWAEGYRSRGVIHVHLERLKAAKADLERYLLLAPEADDRAHVEQQLRAIQSALLRLN